MQALEIIKELSSLPNRLGGDEKIAAKLLCQKLNQADISFSIQKFPSQTPQYTAASLLVDGQPIDCLPCGLKSGQITNNYNLISSLTSSQNFIDTPNINFNPKSDAICLCNFYFAPALAISRNDVEKVMRATDIKGSLTVRPKSYTAQNILVGNQTNPKAVVFAHYDAYFSGATDNASGVATVLSLIIQQKKLLKDNLFVLAGNEELSYDYPVYWGRCFRQFQDRNPGLLEQTKTVYVVDSVGDGQPILERDPKLAKLAFPIDDYPAILEKTTIVTGDFDALMSAYHSPIDLPGRLESDYLEQTVKLLQELLSH